MRYYFIRATCQYGPINFCCLARPGETYLDAMERQATRRGVILCDWTAEVIFRCEWLRIMRRAQ